MYLLPVVGMQSVAIRACSSRWVSDPRINGGMDTGIHMRWYVCVYDELEGGGYLSFFLGVVGMNLAMLSILCNSRKYGNVNSK